MRRIVWKFYIWDKEYSLVYDGDKYCIYEAKGGLLMSDVRRRSVESRFKRHLDTLCEMDKLRIEHFAEYNMLIKRW